MIIAWSSFTHRHDGMDRCQGRSWIELEMPVGFSPAGPPASGPTFEVAWPAFYDRSGSRLYVREQPPPQPGQ